ncbi:hypothetical protein COCOBI_18-2010 [Coccomyxa sp. Obi]|nr:hypothetical protein COCOBI_18-2010 [Coccomyxa sp. Obi]
MGLRRAVLIISILAWSCASNGQVVNLYLTGNDAVVDLGSVLSKTGRLPPLCAGQVYSLTGNYSLEGVCSNDPPFTATLSVDANPIYNPTGLSDTFDVPIPAIITDTPGTHTFTIVFNGGTYSNSASCADRLNFGLPVNSLGVSVVNCTRPLSAVAPGPLAGAGGLIAPAPESAPAGEAAPALDPAASTESTGSAPFATTDLQARLQAHKEYIQATVQAASEAAAKEALEQFG